MDAKPGESIDIPHTQLSDSALRGVLEWFVLREGTDYGEQEVPLEQKVVQVLEQLERGEARIVFYPDTGSVDIILTRARPPKP